tara:strand:- start:385 stop:564 length:180 start_codon:yes stop_codon:yes gene_type:complete
MIDTDKYEDEIYERLMELEWKAKTFVLSKDEREEYEELMAMWDEIQEDYKPDLRKVVKE